MKRAYKQWIKSGLLIAITFFLIALTNFSNWVALPIIAALHKTSSSPNITNSTVATTAGDVFGYSAVFDEELKQIGQISPQDFTQRYASNAQYLPQISWDPTTAKFWDKFNLSPEDVKINVDLSEAPDHLILDFRLSPEELAVFKQNGFVVSERMSVPSFASLFYSQ